MAKKPTKKPTSKAARTAVAVKRSAAAKPKKNGANKIARLEPAETQKYILGSSKIFTPEVINDIHIKAELGRYRMRGFSLFKKIPHWDDLTFLPGTLTRFVIEGYREKCETKTIIGPQGEASAGARHSGLRHRHELRRAVLRGQDRAGPRRHHGGLRHLLGRGRHDP